MDTKHGSIPPIEGKDETLNKIYAQDFNVVFPYIFEEWQL
jgi:hypothetical protein